MRTARKIVHIDEEKCNGCGQCVAACAEGAIELVGGKARLVAERYCDGLAACLGECPVDAISIIEREADSFDQEAVERYLTAKKTIGAGSGENPPFTDPAESPALPCGCPSTQLQMFTPPPEEQTGEPGTRQATRLTHWPVQIKLVPPTAPFLRNADLLVASDCTSVAYPNFHEDLLKGRVVMMGCPKFDDTAEYIEKFTRIFSTADIKSVTIAIMEVPCCSKMPLIVETAMKRSGKTIPTETIVISSRGNMVRRTALET
ncbi:MAG: 4Fe-4S dicluster domain-containing protein [Syntrophorhabdaceae bacterium]|nr:4Fe-4S dicluster domain-containing protein [Syntrophorhabdaceae bacterium]